MLLRHLAGEAIDSIALRYGCHPDVVTEVLGQAPCARQTSQPTPEVTAESIRQQVRSDFKLGNSIRSIAEKYGFPRKLVTAWLSEK